MGADHEKESNSCGQIEVKEIEAKEEYETSFKEGAYPKGNKSCFE